MRTWEHLRRSAVRAAAIVVAAASIVSASPAHAADVTFDPAGIVGPNGLCVDVTAARAADGTPVRLYPCNGTAAQHWTRAADGTLRALGGCLTYDEGAASAELHSCSGRAAQRWSPNDEGGWIIAARQGCLTAAGTTLVVTTCDGRPTQRFGVPVPTGAITGIAGSCLDVAGAQDADGTPVQLYGCNETAAQEWHRYPDGTIRALGKCLDVTAGSTDNGTLVQLYSCNGTAAQLWRLHADGTVLNPRSGRCLDAVDSRSALGTRTQLWDCFGGANQQWTVPWWSEDGTTVGAEWWTAQGRFVGTIRLDGVRVDGASMRLRGALRGTVTGRHGEQVSDVAIIDGSTLPPTPDTTLHIASASCAAVQLELGPITAQGAMGGDGPTSDGMTTWLVPDAEEADAARRFCRLADAVTAGDRVEVVAARLNAVL